MRPISILGSPGSVGRSTLAVVDAFPEELKVVGLAAGANLDLLIEQVERYEPELVSVRDPRDIEPLRARLHGRRIAIVSGADGACDVASIPPPDAVSAPLVGAAGLPPVHSAPIAGKPVGPPHQNVPSP